MNKDARPHIAIIDPNTLSVLGLKQLLQNVMPIATIDTFGTMSELMANSPERYMHYFVATNIVLENRAFFTEHQRKTIVLTLSLNGNNSLTEFHSLCINVPEAELIRSLLTLQHRGHANGRNMPEMPKILQQKILSDREIEVMSLIVHADGRGERILHQTDLVVVEVHVRKDLLQYDVQDITCLEKVVDT